MSHRTSSSFVAKLATAAVAIGSLVASGGVAEAGHFHAGGGFHGSVHMGGGGGFHFSGGVHVSAHYARPAFHGGGYGVRGGVHGYYHGGYGYRGGYWPHYYPYWYGGYSYYYPEYVPSYYPVEAAPVAAYAPAAIAPRPQLPRFGIGVGVGGSSVDLGNGRTTDQTSDVALLARFRLTPGLILEGELGKDSMGANNERVDRRLGGSLIYEFGAYNHLAPYVLAGIGAQQADVGGGSYSTTQDFAEVGLGLRYAFSPHLHLAFDVRAGSRESVSNDGSSNSLTATERTVAPPSSTSSSSSEDYTRARLSAIVYF